MYLDDEYCFYMNRNINNLLFQIVELSNESADHVDTGYSVSKATKYIHTHIHTTVIRLT